MKVMEIWKAWIENKFCLFTVNPFEQVNPFFSIQTRKAVLEQVDLCLQLILCFTVNPALGKIKNSFV